ncbi:diacylglycerol kinase [Campylobacter sp. RM15925]|uniref:diacylglycerol kinase n=1 Tax=Campylobacter sp. RM15925 TaxID=1705724 RepID=UPI00147534DA|nr:diacylglycerol kinase [Campylobacter sp. RM15925]
MRNQPKYKFFKNWSYAIAGLKEIFKNESSFRLEIYIFLPAFISLLFWNFGAILNLFLIFSMVLVLVCECINSAIERIVDLASPEIHPLAGAAKDAGSAAVMICNTLCAGVWIYAIWDKF